MNRLVLLLPALAAGAVLTGCVAYPAGPAYGGGYSGYGGGYAAQPGYGQPGVAVVDVNVGWHGDRYWDGRRYWGRDEWNRSRRPGGYDDRGHARDHDDRRW
ncbi:hypothetical protein EFP18_23960 [Burkholderia glumae]|uniref:hypothetical protein n=1 Tax=Burkholderia glumae TaxID=337 RepID=UPI0005C29DAE|nr:hypothetical protein [Burkholderia glumae]MCM2493128.1 hypothetical protein [Burkholderia glumae]MCM2544191.1 hypothetical protein [Burkholderia glumae]MCM2547921.1 hypothetical protein [Burkholderia glumae]MCQ0029812.1 hypothetical protein [Burkholderia glumae]MCQ0040377.1 hypothetical protein [Burkholderia glumae]